MNSIKAEHFCPRQSFQKEFIWFSGYNQCIQIMHNLVFMVSLLDHIKSIRITTKNKFLYAPWNIHRGVMTQ